MSEPTWQIIEGDALERLHELPAESVQCCITSPPFYGLRDYGVDGQLGLEAAPDEYVARLVEVFREVKRVLRADGTLWLNMGDSYAGGSTGAPRSGEYVGDGGSAPPNVRNRNGMGVVQGAKPKDLLGMPWLLAFALRADGWYLRSDIIWSKPNPMPESVTDRPTSAHEHVFLLAKRSRYYFDADAIRESGTGRVTSGNGQRIVDDSRPGTRVNDHLGSSVPWTNGEGGRNRRNVWEIATQPYPEAHFATFSTKLVEPCVLAGSSPQACGECGAPWRRVVEAEYEWYRERKDRKVSEHSGYMGREGHARKRVTTTGWEPSCAHDDNTGSSTILDPFAGAGTTGLVALRHGRSFIGIELSPAYCEMGRQRIRGDAPLLNCHCEVAA